MSRLLRKLGHRNETADCRSKSVDPGSIRRQPFTLAEQLDALLASELQTTFKFQVSEEIKFRRCCDLLAEMLNSGAAIEENVGKVAFWALESRRNDFLPILNSTYPLKFVLPSRKYATIVNVRRHLSLIGQILGTQTQISLLGYAVFTQNVQATRLCKLHTPSYYLIGNAGFAIYCNLAIFYKLLVITGLAVAFLYLHTFFLKNFVENILAALSPI